MERDLSTRAEERLARLVTYLAASLVLCVGIWEIGGPILVGHTASNASMGIIADNMWTWGIARPVWHYTQAAPGPELTYCHHPWGIFWTTAIAEGIFGRSDWVCRLPAVVLSTLTPVWLSALGRALYRPIAGAVAALTLVATPITLSFASFNALEVPVLAYGSVFLLGYVRFRASELRRDLALMLGAALLLLHADWPGYVLVLGVLVIDLGSMIAGRARPPWGRALAWSSLAGIALATGAFYLAVFASLGRLDDLFGSYRMRSAGPGLASVLEERAGWDVLMFTPVVLGLGSASLVVVAARAWNRRCSVELVPLAIFAMAAFQYVAFPQGARVHVFWPHHFALAFALGAAAIAASIAPHVGRMLGSKGWRRVPSYGVVLGGAALVLVPSFLDAMSTLAWARRTGGRFDEKGVFIQTGGDAIALLRAVTPELPRDARCALHASVSPTWAHVWSLDGRATETTALLPREGADADLFFADARRLTPSDVTALCDRFEVLVVGPLVVVRPGEAPSLKVMRFEEREPTSREQLFISATEPQRTLVDDPWGAWELGDHYDLDLPLPSAPPRTFEERRIAHNAAIARSDLPDASALEAGLRAELTPLDAVFDGGPEIVGMRFEPGVSPRARVLVRANGPLTSATRISLVGRMERAPTLSLTPSSAVERELLAPPFPAAALWRAGSLYSLVAPLLERPGVERFALRVARGGVWLSTSDGRTEVELPRR